MKYKHNTAIRSILILLLVVAGLWAIWGTSYSSAHPGDLFNSPLPTPTPSLSEEAQKALRYISKQYDIPLESLLIANEHERAYPSLDRKFRAFIILDMRTSESPEYALLIDLATGEIEEDWTAVERAAKVAHRAKYGKLEPALYERLQDVSDDTVLPIAIWAAYDERQRSVQEVYAELAKRFPEAEQALSRGEGIV